MRKILFFLLFISCALTVGAQSDTITQKLLTFVSNVRAFNHLYPQEKVYLHFDNKGYYVGETMWFQAYVVAGATLAPTAQSAVLYVDLVSAEGEVVETKKLKVENGRAAGDFLLKNNFYAGFYEVRAYTRCMLNFDNAGIYSRVFPVYNKPRVEGNYVNKKMTLRDRKQSTEVTRQDALKLSALNVTFYPEGGNLIRGVENRVAFKACDSRGQSVSMSGTLYNAQGEFVATLSTIHDGMGFFDVTPDIGSYTAKINYEGKMHNFHLPKVQISGYALRIDNLNSQNLRVRILKSPDMVKNKVGVMLMVRGEPRWFEVCEVGDKGQATFVIPKQDLPTGVAQVTLFSAEGEAYAERLLFVNSKDYVQLKPMVHTSFEPFKPINISFHLADPHGSPIKTPFSLSVYDAETVVPTGHSSSIMTSLLLTSDIKGYVENPDFYFEADDRLHRQALDLLMMVQGWSRYEWKTLAGVKPFKVKHWIEEGLLVDGAVLSDVRKKPMGGVELNMWLSSPDYLSQRGTCITDESGRFNFLLEPFWGVSSLNLMSKQKGKTVRSSITLDRDFEVAPRPYLTYETDFSWAMKNTSGVKVDVDTSDNPPYAVNTDKDSVSREYRMAEVTITDKNKWLAPRAQYATISYDIKKEIDKIRDKGGREQGNFLDFMSSMNFLTCKEERIDVVSDGMYLGATYKAMCTYKGRPVRFVVNNTLNNGPDFQPSVNEATEDWSESVNQVYVIDELLAEDVERVMIDEEGRSCYRCEQNTVVIYVYTNKNGRRRIEQKGIRSTTFQGYSKPAEFYSPSYRGYVLPGDKDFRRTLYWNPNVVPDSLGHAVVHFDNNGTCEKIVISAESITDSGLPIWSEGDVQ